MITASCPIAYSFDLPWPLICYCKLSDADEPKAACWDGKLFGLSVGKDLIALQP